MKARTTARFARLALAGAAAAFALGACGQKGAAPPAAQPGERAVATVNGQAVWASDVNREAVAQGIIGPGEPLDPASMQFRQVLDEVIDQKLLADEAVRRGLDKDPAVKRRLDAARDRVLGDIVLERAVGRVVNPGAINGLYSEMLKNQSATEQIHIRQIVVPSEAEADAVKTMIAGGQPFETVAAERSRDEASRFQGGALPPLTEDLLPAGYAAALKDAKIGALVGPFKAGSGWVVARIDDRRQEPPISLEAARPQIIRFLTFDQVKDLILDLRRRAKVRTLIGPPQAVPGAPTEPASAPPAAAAPAGAKPTPAPAGKPAAAAAKPAAPLAKPAAAPKAVSAAKPAVPAPKAAVSAKAAASASKPAVTPAAPPAKSAPSPAVPAKTAAAK